MAFWFQKNDQKNLPSNVNLNQFQSNIGKSTYGRVNYHYLHKEKEKSKENQISNIDNNKNCIPISSLFINNNNTYHKEEENKGKIFNTQNMNYGNYRENKNEIKFNQNNRNFSENKLMKGLKYDSNFVQDNQKSLKAKELMDNFDKRLFDTKLNFYENNTKGNNEDIKKEKPNELPNNQRNFNHNRNLSFDKYSHNFNKIYNNSTLKNTESVYKNYFQNNFPQNIQRINTNRLAREEYNKYNNIYPKNNYKRNNIFERVNYKIKKFSSFSMEGTDASRHPKTNQDSFLIKEDENNYIFGIFDGHGIEGHLISQSIKNYLNYNANSNSFNSNNNILSLFNNLSSSINSSTSFKALESGSTAILTFINNEKIICANCGDSRAILISENENKIIPLSRDHKPELPEEKERIIKCGGRVDKIFGMGPFRVWFQDADYPGLAMSRSIGDGYAHKIGVIDVPEILEFNLMKVRPKAIILASDGVFEFVKNEDIKDIIEKYFYNMDAQGCAKEIVEYSRKIWENSGYAIDDITCIVAFFESL